MPGASVCQVRYTTRSAEGSSSLMKILGHSSSRTLPSLCVCIGLTLHSRRWVSHREEHHSHCQINRRLPCFLFQTLALIRAKTTSAMVLQKTSSSSCLGSQSSSLSHATLRSNTRGSRLTYGKWVGSLGCVTSWKVAFAGLVNAFVSRPNSSMP